jgi:hypothetical protein
MRAKVCFVEAIPACDWLQSPSKETPSMSTLVDYKTRYVTYGELFEILREVLLPFHQALDDAAENAIRSEESRQEFIDLLIKRAMLKQAEGNP